MIADFSYYSEVYLGKMSQAEFDRFSAPAQACLDTFTAGKIYELAGSREQEQAQRAKNALCAVADELCAMQDTQGIAAESNDGISVSYRDKKRRLYNAAALYLLGTDALFCAV